MNRRAEPGGGVLPDHYRPAAGGDVPEGRACGNCNYYDETMARPTADGVEVWCRQWAAYVRGDHYCDHWESADAATGSPDYERSEEAPMKRGQLKNVKEIRNWGLTDVEVREEADGMITFAGYATVFNRDYSVYDMFGEFNERIAPEAFDRTLREDPDVVLVVNHGGLPLARTKSGTLRLMTDSIGLRVEAQLDQTDPDVQALVPKMRRGDVDEMSFAFRVTDDRWSDDYTERTITAVNLHRGDVSVVTFGANPHTMAALRAALRDESVREQLIAADPEAARVLSKHSIDPYEDDGEPDIQPPAADTEEERELREFVHHTAARLLAAKARK